MGGQSFTPRQLSMLWDQFAKAGINKIPGSWLIDGSVFGVKLSDGTITDAKIVNGTLTFAKAAAGEFATFAQGALADTAIQPDDDAALNSLTLDENLVFPKTAGYGIKIDTAAPDWGWRDMLGAISIRGVGATDPSYNVYQGGIRGYQFDPAEEVFVEFHIPHDYVPGTDLYIHFHWSLNGKTTAGVAAGTVTGGTTTWGAEATYAKGHNQAAFLTPITTTVASGTVAATLYQHYITEVQLTDPAPSASQIDSDIIETDGLLLVRAYLSANNITVAAGAQPDPFLHFVDIHYQSTGIGTKNKAPDFWT